MKNNKINFLYFLTPLILVSIFSLLTFSFTYFNPSVNFSRAGNFELEDQAATIGAINKNMDAVVSIVVYQDEEIISYDLSTGEQSIEKENMQVGAGTGFIVSSEGLILTNKHVIDVEDPDNVQYRIILNSGKKYYALLIDKDPVNDLAVLRIYDHNLPFVEFGNSDDLEVGATVIAIGNALGKYPNSVTKGIVSGLGRDFVATGPRGFTEVLNNIIQTDAEINHGNSGGPLIDLNGKVVGVNVAIDNEGGSIGFAIPINEVVPVIDSVKENSLIIRPYLGVRFFIINSEVAEEKGLFRDSGALLVKGKSEEEVAVVPGSPAFKADILEGDIVFEVNAIKINKDNNLQEVIQKYNPGDRVGLKIQRGDEIIIREVTLGKFPRVK
ncbi:trypsin-like peptidase domain-containing protein [bacterium]|nr:trypsin-like peptidase domain-containing protein [bacterium]